MNLDEQPCRSLLRRAAISSSVILTLSFSARVGQAQIAYDGPKGRIEVVGLHRWTLQMLQDSVRHYVPGQELNDRACMVTLRDSLHFADASVDYFFSNPAGGSATVFLSIKVIEPQDSAAVQWDGRRRSDFSSLLPDYAPLVLAVTDSAGAMWQGRILQWLQFYHSDSLIRSAMLARSPEAGRGDARRLWQFLDGHQGQGDRQRAIRVLETSGFFPNRVVASAVLSNFAASDSTWWVLLRSLRDPHEAIRGVAQSVLEHLPPRAIDWAPVTADLRLLLGGTNLSAMVSVIELLDRTAVRTEMASPMLRHNTDWLLAMVASEDPMAQPAAHRLLVRLNHGIDLGSKRADWLRWASAL